MTIDHPLDSSLQPSAARKATAKINGELIELHDWTPTVRQLLAASGHQPATEYAFLRWPDQGATEELSLDEVVNLPSEGRVAEFLAIHADGVFYFVLNDERFAWAGRLTETDVRRVARIPDNMDIMLERRSEPDLVLEHGAMIDLAAPGVERLRIQKRRWKLDVHGVVIESDQPTITVREALVKANIDPNAGWSIRLKVHGEPKRKVGLDDTIDLTHPGIERLKLLEDKINNGEAVAPIQRHFRLLEKDEAYLDNCGLHWETMDDGRRWLLISNFPVPSGYHQDRCCLAIEIPQNYPVAEIDMFYCDPPLTLASGAGIPQTEYRQMILNRAFQRWSRHREPGQWSPVRDSVLSHLGLVEESMAREIGQ
ncbi:multiubiquitin domain-containing protein [Stutzerimonas kunmingensis]|uniref:multiubiquitin domain-containing protein n=1 Tax=Stutzerimonas kunmingensis TaxID=1211807 RepID=UPI0025AA30C9|nr:MULTISPECIES: multiubiquitin domain-containing protein [Pseudomonadaceae]MDM9652472.1 E2/UBC family protein [Pseudomonas wenzhouensis]